MRSKLLAILLVVTSCLPANAAELPIRAKARAVVLNIAWALHAADEVCAAKVTSLPDKAQAEALATKCIAGIESGRDSLVVAEKLLDTWDDAKAGQMYCAAKAGVAALRDLGGVLTAAGAKVPPEVNDAVTVASWVGVLCDQPTTK